MPDVSPRPPSFPHRRAPRIATATPSPRRLVLLDLLRAVALLGILFVNLPNFALPLSEAFGPPLPHDARTTTGEIAAWWFVQAFCQFKFVSLYSLLFGAGMVILFDRIRAAHHAWPTLLRRLAILFVFGVLHAVILWHGDILVCYAIMGLFLLPVLRIRGIALIALGVVVFVASTVFQVVSIRGQLAAWERGDLAWMFELSSTNELDVALDDQCADDATVVDRTSSAASSSSDRTIRFDHFDLADVTTSSHSWDLDRWLAANADVGPLTRVLRLGRLVAMDSTDPRTIAFETRVLRDGPYLDACALRAVVAGTLELEGFLGWNWHVLALFLFGAGAMRLGFFGPAGGRWRRWALVLLPIGLLGENLWAWMLLRSMSEWDPRAFTWEPYRASTAILTMFGYVGVISLILDRVDRPGRPRLPRSITLLTTTGRMGLTGYIGESVLAAFVMYSWGLATFGTWSRLELVCLTPVLFGAVVLFANLWSLRFDSGPLEWLWRRGVHGRSGPGGSNGRNPSSLPPNGAPRQELPSADDARMDPPPVVTSAVVDSPASDVEDRKDRPVRDMSSNQGERL